MDSSPTIPQAPAKDPFKPFKLLMYSIMPMPLLTGLIILIRGMRSQEIYGAALDDDQYLDPLFNNNLRFIASFWLGTFFFIRIFLSDVSKYQRPLRLLLGLTALGVLMRCASIVQYGMPTGAIGWYYVIGATALEVFLVPTGLFLLNRGLQEHEKQA